MIRVKRVYGPPEPSDGLRILVDRLWPRGLSKEKAKLYLWMREISPSDELRKWFAHDPKKWQEFRNKYFEELEGKTSLTKQLKALSKKGTITLLFGAKDEEHNQAVALKAFLTSAK